MKYVCIGEFLFRAFPLCRLFLILDNATDYNNDTFLRLFRFDPLMT